MFIFYLDMYFCNLQSILGVLNQKCVLVLLVEINMVNLSNKS